MQSIGIEGASFDVASGDMDEQILHMFAQQAPREKLRPLGLNDKSIPIAMRTLFKIKPIRFSSRESNAVIEFFTTLHDKLLNVRYLPNTDVTTISSRTSKFFYTKEMGSMFDESNYSLMSCDLDDMEAVSASRLLYSLLQGFTHDSGNSKKSCVDSHDL